VKNPIPPQWAKDHLRALNEDSISKAFAQMKLIMEFLRTESGKLFLRSMLPEEGLPYFENDFLIGCSGLIITSQNAGMFFAGKNQTIIDYRTLDRILRKCDGDVTYVLSALKNVGNLADEGLSVVPIGCTVGSRMVTYEVVKIASLMDFQQHEYRSSGIDKKMSEEFIEDGLHPFDTVKKKEKFH